MVLESGRTESANLPRAAADRPRGLVCACVRRLLVCGLFSGWLGWRMLGSIPLVQSFVPLVQSFVSLVESFVPLVESFAPLVQSFVPLVKRASLLCVISPSSETGRGAAAAAHTLSGDTPLIATVKGGFEDLNAHAGWPFHSGLLACSPADATLLRAKACNSSLIS